MELADLRSYMHAIDPIDAAVYALVMIVPPGRVVSYSTIAKLLEVHPRRVAQALRRNQIPIIIPCHRVVMKSGALGGYSRGGPKVKEKLLRLEGVEVINGRVPKRYFFCESLARIVGMGR